MASTISSSGGGGAVSTGGKSAAGGGSGDNSNAAGYDQTSFANNLGSAAQTGFNNGYAVNPEFQYAGLGAETLGSLGGLTAAAGQNSGGLMAANTANTNLINSSPGDVNPYFEANLQKTLGDAGTGVNAALGANGRFGSNVHVDKLGETLGGISNTARQGQYQYQQGRIDNAVNQAGQLYQNSLMPYQTGLGVGQALDADRQASIDARNAQFRDTNDAHFNNLSRYTSLLSGQPQQAAEANPWLDALGVAGTVASIFL